MLVNPISVLNFLMMKLKNNYTGKKSPTNPVKKEKHEDRKVKKVLLKEIREEDQQQQIKDYIYANPKI